jgi:hypothetical protein
MLMLMTFFGWLLLSLVIGALASGRNRSFGGWLLISLVISPLLAGVFLLLAGKKEPPEPVQAAYAIDATGETKKCPACAESVKVEALVCRFCSHAFDPEETRRLIAEKDAFRELVHIGPFLIPPGNV